MGVHIRCKHDQYKCEYAPESMADYRTDDELMCGFHCEIDSFLDRIGYRKVWWLWFERREGPEETISKGTAKGILNGFKIDRVFLKRKLDGSYRKMCSI